MDGKLGAGRARNRNPWRLMKICYSCVFDSCVTLPISMDVEPLRKPGCTPSVQLPARPWQLSTDRNRPPHRNMHRTASSWRTAALQLRTELAWGVTPRGRRAFSYASICPAENGAYRVQEWVSRSWSLYSTVFRSRPVLPRRYRLSSVSSAKLRRSSPPHHPTQKQRRPCRPSPGSSGPRPRIRRRRTLSPAPSSTRKEALPPTTSSFRRTSPSKRRRVHVSGLM